MSTSQTPHRRRFRKGAVQAAVLLENRIREVGESRGFAVSRLLTRWDEIAGPELSAIARPVEVSFSRGGMGATLTVLTTGAQAPMLEMQKERLREKVNACYGYQAIRRVRLTQTAPTGFSGASGSVEGPSHPPEPDDRAVAAARASTEGIADASLRQALERLGANVLSSGNRKKGTP
jgi:hypothetical protein